MTTFHYRIMGNHQGLTQELDSTDDVREAMLWQHDYQNAYGDSWVVWVEVQRLEDGVLYDVGVYDCLYNSMVGLA